VSTDVGGISEYFPKSFGFLVQPKDKKALKNAILKIYNANIKPNKLKMHQYAVDNFSPDSINASFTKLYNETLNLQN